MIKGGTQYRKTTENEEFWLGRGVISEDIFEKKKKEIREVVMQTPGERVFQQRKQPVQRP